MVDLEGDGIHEFWNVDEGVAASDEQHWNGFRPVQKRNETLVSEMAMERQLPSSPSCRDAAGSSERAFTCFVRCLGQMGRVDQVFQGSRLPHVTRAGVFVFLSVCGYK